MKEKNRMERTRSKKKGVVRDRVEGGRAEQCKSGGEG